MSSTWLERARANQEDIEAYEKGIAQQLEDKPKKNKDRVWQHQRIAILLEKIAERSAELTSIYEDAEGVMKEEVAAMRGRDAFDTFYKKLTQAKEYHQRHPDLPVKHQPNVAEESEPKVLFSGDEVFGKYLDLHALYIAFYALPQFATLAKDEQVDYVTFVSRVANLADLPEQHKSGAGYAAYVKDLLEYLHGFVRRTQPLMDLDDVTGPKAEEEFAKAWEAGTVPGWTKKGPEATANGASKGPKAVDLSRFVEAKQLEALGLERLKEGLSALGMKCGGTLTQRAERLFSAKGKQPKDIDPKLLAKPAANKEGSAPTGAPAAGNHRRNLALMEFKVSRLADVLRDVLEATARFAEKKQTRTVEEREAELREEEEGMLPEVSGEGNGEEGEADDEDDEEEPVYNPKNLPLGYDGKPIPYWLYKLHGLGVEYKCEICGNFSYMGRRAFDRHFQEWRHAHGMRCLKIPNTKHFHDITSIQDAVNLYAKIKDQIKAELYDGEAEEEFEDSEGNVLNKRTYQDLARQGLL